VRSGEESRLVEKVETQLPALESSATVARAFLRSTLETWQLDGFGEVTEVLTSELVTNVVRHVGSPMTLRALRQPSSIRVEVEDSSSDTPFARDAKPLDETGRGLLLVAALADEWGVTQHGDHGKTVWFEIDVTTATTKIHGA
jgi:anti-sigma regulatory factor (Ser/Thr protein kinase)